MLPHQQRFNKGSTRNPLDIKKVQEGELQMRAQERCTVGVKCVCVCVCVGGGLQGIISFAQEYP
jgi:hypothetical protein